MSKKTKNGFKKLESGDLSFRFEHFEGGVIKGGDEVNGDTFTARISMSGAGEAPGVYKSEKKAKQHIIDFVKKQLKRTLKEFEKRLKETKADLKSDEKEVEFQQKLLKKLKKV